MGSEHLFQPGVSIDAPTKPDPRWCNVCGERRDKCSGYVVQLRAELMQRGQELIDADEKCRQLRALLSGVVDALTDVNPRGVVKALDLIDQSGLLGGSDG